MGGGCGCGDGKAPPTGWQIPEVTVSTQVQTVPPAPAPQPDRAPAPPAHSVPWWGWLLIVLVGLSLLRASS